MDKQLLLKEFYVLTIIVIAHTVGFSILWSTLYGSITISIPINASGVLLCCSVALYFIPESKWIPPLVVNGMFSMFIIFLQRIQQGWIDWIHLFIVITAIYAYYKHKTMDQKSIIVTGIALCVYWIILDLVGVYNWWFFDNIWGIITAFTVNLFLTLAIYYNRNPATTGDDTKNEEIQLNNE